MSPTLQAQDTRMLARSFVTEGRARLLPIAPPPSGLPFLAPPLCKPHHEPFISLSSTDNGRLCVGPTAGTLPRRAPSGHAKQQETPPGTGSVATARLREASRDNESSLLADTHARARALLLPPARAHACKYTQKRLRTHTRARSNTHAHT